MIVKVNDEERASKCDKLLTKLIQDERLYGGSIADNFEVKDYFKKVIKNKDNILLCYEENNTIKGYIYVKPTYNDEEKGYLIDGLYVEREFRNKKIATTLIEKAINIIKNMDGKFIDINVFSQNKEAIKLYKKFGFDELSITFRKNIKY